MNSITLAAPPHPATVRDARNLALSMIEEGRDASLLQGMTEFDYVLTVLADLKAAGVGPRQAAAMLARPGSPVLRVIHGGGENAPAPSPALRLVAAGEAA